MRNARFLKVFGFAIGLLLLTACSGDDIYRGGGSNSGGYGNSNGYGNYGGYNNGGYYPYGNANYPRDRIYVVNGYNPCNGYVYQGYCYRDKDDYRNAVIWDQNHRNDANWNRKRKDWCNTHDCSRDHDTHGRDAYGRDVVFDAQGKPIQPTQVEKDRPASLPRPSGNKPVGTDVRDDRQHQDHYENRQPVRVDHYPVEYRRPEQTQQPVQREYHPQRAAPVQQSAQPVSSGGNVRQSPPVERQRTQERQPQQEQQKPQRGRAARLGDSSSTSE